MPKLCTSGDGTQGFVNAKKKLQQLSYNLSFFSKYKTIYPQTYLFLFSFLILCYNLSSMIGPSTPYNFNMYMPSILYFKGKI